MGERAFEDIRVIQYIYSSITTSSYFFLTVFSLLRPMIQCESHRSIIRIIQERHFASSAAGNTPHTIPQVLRWEAGRRSGEVLLLVSRATDRPSRLEDSEIRSSGMC
jgi:hypothetical protein